MSGYSSATSTPKPLPAVNLAVVTGSTLHDVSKRSGVSMATVSRVVNGRPNVREETRRRVQHAAKELGYRTNAAARALVSQRTDTVGVVFPNIDNEYFHQILNSINTETRQQGRHLMVGFGLNFEDEQQLLDEYLGSGRVDALIVLNLGMPEDFIRTACAGPVPIILLSQPVEGAAAQTVRMDNYRGAQAALGHLITHHGYRDLAILEGPRDSFDAVERLAGVRDALSESGVSPAEVSFWPGDFYEASGYDAVCDAAARGPLPRAVWAVNDAMAFGALRALRELGRRVPEDVAVMGFDDGKVADALQLSTVRAPLREMGEASARAAIAASDRVKPAPDGHTYCDHVLPTSLVLRRSCGCAVNHTQLGTKRKKPEAYP